MESVKQIAAGMELALDASMYVIHSEQKPRMGVPFNADALQAFEEVMALPTLQLSTSSSTDTITTYFDSGSSNTDKVSNDVNFVIGGGSVSAANLYERVSSNGGSSFSTWVIKASSGSTYAVSNASEGIHQYIWQNTVPSATELNTLTLSVDKTAMTVTAVDISNSNTGIIDYSVVSG